MESFIQESLIVLRLNPGHADPHFDFPGIQFLWLHLLQCRHVVPKQFRVFRGGRLCQPQFVPDIAGKVFICRLPPYAPT